MLKGLKVSSLVRKCVFRRPELTGKLGLKFKFGNAKMKYISELKE